MNGWHRRPLVGSAVLGVLLVLAFLVWGDRSAILQRSTESTPRDLATQRGQPAGSLGATSKAALPAVGAAGAGNAGEAIARGAQPMSDQELRAALENLRQDKATVERLAAMRRLANSDDPEAIRALWEAAGDEDPRVAQAAVGLLTQTGIAGGADAPIEPEAATSKETTEETAESKNEPEPSPIPGLREQLRDPDPAVVAQAIEALETLGGPEAVAALGELLSRSSASSELKVRAIEAVEWIESSDGVNVLRSALWDADLQVAMAAVEALESFSGSALADPAVEALADTFRRSGSLDLQVRALEALSMLDGEHAIAITTQVIEANPEGPLYGAALEVLFDLGDHTNIPQIRNAFETTTDPAARQVLADLLEMLGENVDAG